MKRQQELDNKLLEWGLILKEGLESEEMNVFFDASDEDGYLCFLVVSYVRKRLGKKPPFIVGTSKRSLNTPDFNKTMSIFGPKAKQGFYTFDVPVGNAFPYAEHIKLAIDNHLNLKSAPSVRTNIDAIWGTDKGKGKLLSNYNLNSVHILLACLKAVGIDVLEDVKRIDSYYYENSNEDRLSYRIMYDLLSVGDCEYSTLTGDYNPNKQMAFGKDNSVGKNKDFAFTRKDWSKRLRLENIHLENTFIEDTAASVVFGLKEHSKFRMYFIEKLIKQINGEPEKTNKLVIEDGWVFYYLRRTNVIQNKDNLVQVYMNNSVDSKKHYGEKIIRTQKV